MTTDSNSSQSSWESAIASSSSPLAQSMSSADRSRLASWHSSRGETPGSTPQTYTVTYGSGGSGGGRGRTPMAPGSTVIQSPPAPPKPTNVRLGGTGYTVEQKDGKYYVAGDKTGYSNAMDAARAASKRDIQSKAAGTDTKFEQLQDRVDSGVASQQDYADMIRYEREGKTSSPYTLGGSGRKWTEAQLQFVDPVEAAALRYAASTGSKRPTISSYQFDEKQPSLEGEIPILLPSIDGTKQSISGGMVTRYTPVDVATEIGKMPLTAEGIEASQKLITGAPLAVALQAQETRAAQDKAITTAEKIAAKETAIIEPYVALGRPLTAEESYEYVSKREAAGPELKELKTELTTAGTTAAVGAMATKDMVSDYNKAIAVQTGRIESLPYATALDIQSDVKGKLRTKIRSTYKTGDDILESGAKGVGFGLAFGTGAALLAGPAAPVAAPVTVVGGGLLGGIGGIAFPIATSITAGVQEAALPFVPESVLTPRVMPRLIPSTESGTSTVETIWKAATGEQPTVSLAEYLKEPTKYPQYEIYDPRKTVEPIQMGVGLIGSIGAMEGASKIASVGSKIAVYAQTRAKETGSGYIEYDPATRLRGGITRSKIDTTIKGKPQNTQEGVIQEFDDIARGYAEKTLVQSDKGQALAGLDVGRSAARQTIPDKAKKLSQFVMGQTDEATLYLTGSGPESSTTYFAKLARTPQGLAVTGGKGVARELSDDLYLAYVKSASVSKAAPVTRQEFLYKIKTGDFSKVGQPAQPKSGEVIDLTGHDFSSYVSTSPTGSAVTSGKESQQLISELSKMAAATPKTLPLAQSAPVITTTLPGVETAGVSITQGFTQASMYAGPQGAYEEVYLPLSLPGGAVAPGLMAQPSAVLEPRSRILPPQSQYEVAKLAALDVQKVTSPTLGRVPAASLLQKPQTSQLTEPLQGRAMEPISLQKVELQSLTIPKVKTMQVTKLATLPGFPPFVPPTTATNTPPWGGFVPPAAMGGGGGSPKDWGGGFIPFPGPKKQWRPAPKLTLLDVFNIEARTGTEAFHPTGARAERMFERTLAEGGDFTESMYFGTPKTTKGKKRKEITIF